MRRLVPLLLLTLFAAGASRPISPVRSSCKPTPPIDIDARIVGDPSAPFGIVARATSPTGAEIDLEIILPDGVTHLAGQKRHRAKSCDLRIDVQARDRSRQEILVRASFTRENATMTRVVPLVLFDPPAPPKQPVLKNSRGEAILEFSP
jgi:hypothetical protein